MTQAAEKREVKAGGSTSEKVDFNWEDPLDLEGELTEEERMVRDTARAYAQEKLFPLPDTNSELEIQTEGGEGTTYAISIWINVGNGMPAQPSILLNHRMNNVVDQDVVQNNVAVKRSSALNKYGEQNVRIDTSHAAPGPVS